MVGELAAGFLNFKLGQVTNFKASLKQALAGVQWLGFG